MKKSNWKYLKTSDLQVSGKQFFSCRLTFLFRDIREGYEAWNNAADDMNLFPGGVAVHKQTHKSPAGPATRRCADVLQGGHSILKMWYEAVLQGPRGHTSLIKRIGHNNHCLQDWWLTIDRRVVEFNNE